MKICFFMQRSFVKIGHALAINLKNYGYENFCAITTTQFAYNFLNSQKEIKYSAILSDEEIHKHHKEENIDLEFLKNLGKEYGIPNLWPYLSVDRTIMYSIMPREYPSDKPLYTHEEMMQILQITAKAIIKFLREEKPDFVCFSVVGSLASMLLYHIAKKMNIKTIIFYPPCVFKNTLQLSEDNTRLSWSEKIFDEIRNGTRKSPLEEKAKEIIKEFREMPVPYYEGFSPKKAAKTRIEVLKFLVSPRNIFENVSLILRLFFKKNKDYTEGKPLWFIADRIKRKARGFAGYSDLYDKPEEGKDFCFFPLKGEPEMSLYAWAPFHINQIEVARQIARALPLHFKLYVKEHPSMFGYRTRRYYKELKKIPNLKLIDPKIPSHFLIKQAKLVTVIAGTPGFEGLIFRKPVISFGDVYYNKISTVKKCEAMKDLSFLVKEQLENFRHDEQELIDFASSVLEESIEVDWIDLWHKEKNFEKIKNDPGILKVAESLSKKLAQNE